MKCLKNILLFIFASVVIISCSKDDDNSSEATGYIIVDNKEYVLTSGDLFEYGETEQGSGVYKFSVSLSTYESLDGFYLVSNINDPSDTLTKDIRAKFDIFSSDNQKLNNGNYQYNFTENANTFNSSTLSTSNEITSSSVDYEISSCALEALEQRGIYQLSFAGTVNDSIEFNGYYKGKLIRYED
ncbi:hypothetical protein ACFQ3R_03095 [Mesonia ostreae]|uniref:Uncharacterized protein n=1 Tax=Mesonia ostreae TaxID=861110 RepID=A0ABU2KKH2_9FLAO|nr:hypothetical protein [Mesonia ostreae]MDT0295222.1 hypothetical protein [Mesonia ostreae]